MHKKNQKIYRKELKLNMAKITPGPKKYRFTETLLSYPYPDNEYPFWIPQCGITYKDPKYHEIRLDSNVSCIEYVISGSGIINSNKKSFIVNRGDSYMLCEGNEHNYYADPNDPFHKIWFNFSGVLSKEIIKIYGLDDTVLFKNINTMPFIEEMHNICRNNDDPEVIQAEASLVFLKTIQFLAKNYSKISTDSTPVDMIRYYIDCNITKNIKLSDIVAITHYTPQYIIRIFKQKFGITPHQYIIDSKIRISLTMLRSTTKTIEEISTELSFSDPHHFSYLFEKKTGMRPTAYRKSTNKPKL